MFGYQISILGRRFPSTKALVGSQSSQNEHSGIPNTLSSLFFLFEAPDLGIEAIEVQLEFGYRKSAFEVQGINLVVATETKIERKRTMTSRKREGMGKDKKLEEKSEEKRRGKY